MKKVVIVVEEDALNKPLYFGKSGDLAIIDYFLRKKWSVILLNANTLQEKVPQLGYKVQYQDYTQIFHKTMLNECHNILDESTPSTNGEHLQLNLELTKEGIGRNFLLISRSMPQSINNIFLKNFNILSLKAKYTPQNLEEITIYKDKVIPYLLQENDKNIETLYNAYTKKCSDFKESIKNEFTDLALKTTVIDTSKPFEENYKNIQEIKGKICIKPFNLFGGIGVKLFQNTEQKTEIQTHLELINTYFTEYNIKETTIAIVQEAVSHPQFGDIRALFSFGKFLGAIKRIEPTGEIHNTMHGGAIMPVCNSNFEFHSSFIKKYHRPLIHAINLLKTLNQKSSFLSNEFICGYDLLLTKKFNVFQFKLTETNIACPTGFSFLDTALIISQNMNISKECSANYFINNARTSDITLDYLLQQANL